MTRLSYFISLITIVLAMLVMIIPTEQTWSGGDMALACMATMMLLVASFVMVTYRVRCQVGLIDIVLLSWCFFSVSYAYVAPDFPIASFVVKSVLLLMLFYSLRICLLRYGKHCDILAILIIVITFAEAVMGIYQAAMGYSRNNQYLMTGTFLNPGPYGTLLACGLITLIALRKKYFGIIQSHRHFCLINIIVFLVSSVMILTLLITMSRAAILALIVCIASMYRNRIRKNLLPFGVILFIIVLFLYLIKQDSANSRLIIWQVSLRNIALYPIAGTGPGSFLHQYANGMALFSSSMPDGYFNTTDVVQYAFNFLLLIGVEQGLIGISWAITLILAIYFRLRRSDNVMKWILPLLFVSSLFSYTFELLPFQILTVIACASLLSEEKPCSIRYRACTITVLLICIILSVSVTPFVSVRMTANNRYQKIRGILTAEYIPDYRALYPYMYDNPEFLYDFARMLSNGKQFNESNAVLRDGMLVSADPIFHVLQANNYHDMGEMYLAEQYYWRAFSVMPNRIYPLYRIMQLYAGQEGRQEDALSMAKRIITFPVKVASPATNKMKEDAKSIVNAQYW